MALSVTLGELPELCTYKATKRASGICLASRVRPSGLEREPGWEVWDLLLSPVSVGAYLLLL